MNVTPAEEKKLRKSICPDCGGTKFLGGPRGGLAQNVMCANIECEARFNICGPFTPERIGASKLKKVVSEDAPTIIATRRRKPRFLTEAEVVENEEQYRRWRYKCAAVILLLAGIAVLVFIVSDLKG